MNNISDRNTAVGYFALGPVASGYSNIAVGYYAGSNLNGNYNIDIGTTGGTESNVIRIGTPYDGVIGQNATHIAGIRGSTTGNNDAVAVVIDSNGQLGTVNSSRRYKEDIHDMGEVSDGLLRLRPVTFRYKQPYADGSKPLDYGLIAEEVAEVYPDSVVKGKDGQVETVQYHKLTPMLLNEVQKQQRKIEALEARLAALEALLTDKALATVGH